MNEYENRENTILMDPEFRYRSNYSNLEDYCYFEAQEYFERKISRGGYLSALVA